MGCSEWRNSTGPLAPQALGGAHEVWHLSCLEEGEAQQTEGGIACMLKACQPLACQPQTGTQCPVLPQAVVLTLTEPSAGMASEFKVSVFLLCLH